jgi:hypothetical protein
VFTHCGKKAGVYVFGCVQDRTFSQVRVLKPAGRATNSFEIFSSPHQIKPVAAT